MSLKSHTLIRPCNYMWRTINQAFPGTEWHSVSSKQSSALVDPKCIRHRKSLICARQKGDSRPSSQNTTTSKRSRLLGHLSKHTELLSKKQPWLMRIRVHSKFRWGWTSKLFQFFFLFCYNKVYSVHLEYSKKKMTRSIFLI